MVSRIRSLGIKGVGGYEVSVECSVAQGLPGFEIVGLPDAAVREARDRVRAAIKNSGLKFPVSRLTVNLAPADTKKAGTVYDLPIFLGLLGGITGIFISSKGHGLLWPYSLMQLGMNSNKSADALAGSYGLFAFSCIFWLGTMFLLAWLLLKKRDVRA